MDARRGRNRSILIRSLPAAVCLGAALAIGGCSAAVNPGTPRVSLPEQQLAPETVPAALGGGDVLPDLLTSPPPFPVGLVPATAAPSPGATLTVTDVQVAHHEGFDRVVYEMAGAGMPGWTVGYVSQAVQDGSGMVLELDGQATLWVSISGSGYPSDSGATPFSHPTPVRGDRTTAVTEVQGWSAFEGTTGSFIGVAGTDHAFRVFLLDDPVRLVVDIDEAGD